MLDYTVYYLLISDINFQEKIEKKERIVPDNIDDDDNNIDDDDGLEVVSLIDLQL